MSEPFIGEIRIFAGNFAPRGWAFCDGQLLPVANNTALFSIIGATYGGDGRTTMGLPNLQGRAPMHPGRGPGLTARRLGEIGGTPAVTLTEAQMPSHTHSVNTISGPPAGATPTDAVFARAQFGGSGQVYATPDANMVALSSNTLSPAGASQAHNNMQPYLALSFIIALVGLYPSRS